MNKVILIGRLTKDPEIMLEKRKIKYARYTLAVNRNYKNDEGEVESDFINCICFGDTAKFADEYLKKGMKIAVEGSLNYNSYKNDKDEFVSYLNVIVNRHEFCEKKQD